MRTARRLGLASACLLFPVIAGAGDVRWRKHDLKATSPFEAAGAFDIDGDKVLDILCGDTWYKGPEFRATAKVRDVARQGTYYNCFATLPMDVNGDGRMDYITCSYFGKDVGWVENPGPGGGTWTYHLIDTPGPSEAAVLVDLTGDGKPEVLPNTVNTLVFYELVRAGSSPEWKTHALGKEGAGHGVGTGDINGDGRIDLLTPRGWYEGPAKSGSGSWTFHADWDLGPTGIQILGRDLDGDGRADLVWGMGHNYGLYWAKQGPARDGKTTWAPKQAIDEKLAQVHTLLWADLDGDGQDNELVTGKRVYAHEAEPGDVDPSMVAYYTFDKTSGSWTRHVIAESGPAKAPAKKEERDAQKDFPPGTAGTGLQMTAIDIDGDGDLDLLCPGKSGLYLLENLSK